MHGIVKTMKTDATGRRIKSMGSPSLNLELLRLVLDIDKAKQVKDASVTISTEAIITDAEKLRKFVEADSDKKDGKKK